VKGQMTILDLSITHQKIGKIIIQLLAVWAIAMLSCRKCSHCFVFS